MRDKLSNLVLQKATLILVDIQNDFLESGTLPVPGGNQIIPLINNIQTCFNNIVATKDWHCENHISFTNSINNKGWPRHCVQGTWGAEFPKDLNVKKIKAVFLKGQNKNYDSYSGFYNDFDKKESTGLSYYLKSNSINTVFIAGLALDFCVKETIIDAYKLGFQSYLITDATRSISLSPDIVIQDLKRFDILTCLSKNIFDIQA
ncbi:isochorismatase family protein (plasmid) [Borrelia sp. A-FGy1]|uniref:isochorismatase family protein n=1 Tax=Borrelia sp. A-FGy1 TaxID=2608247 RepID=UPI0015F4B3B4|nr:isochorismatase family protein [Borrelia sp. A-FGy1]QMU99870.1 isochorismatase family protein [Borrelia sp. A-FGy1]